jgi:hypothetical protein
LEETTMGRSFIRSTPQSIKIPVATVPKAKTMDALVVKSIMGKWYAL